MYMCTHTHATVKKKTPHSFIHLYMERDMNNTTNQDTDKLDSDNDDCNSSSSSSSNSGEKLIFVEQDGTRIVVCREDEDSLRLAHTMYVKDSDRKFSDTWGINSGNLWSWRNKHKGSWISANAVWQNLRRIASVQENTTSNDNNEEES